MVVTQMAEDLKDMIYPTLKNFPKSEKTGLVLLIKSKLFEMLSNFYESEKVPSKRKFHAQEASGNLETLRSMLKTARKEKYISNGFFQEIDLKMTDIGKMISGLIRTCNK